MGYRIVNHGIKTPYSGGKDLLLDLKKIHRKSLEASRSLEELGEKSYRYSRKLRISENLPGEQALKTQAEQPEVYVGSLEERTRAMENLNQALGAYLDIIA